jgi:hypothetical protein
MPLPAAIPNHCPDQQLEKEEEEDCQKSSSTACSGEEEEEGVLYSWRPPSASYPCAAGWYTCDICHERRRTDQGMWHKQRFYVQSLLPVQI